MMQICFKIFGSCYWKKITSLEIHILITNQVTDLAHYRWCIKIHSRYAYRSVSIYGQRSLSFWKIFASDKNQFARTICINQGVPYGQTITSQEAIKKLYRHKFIFNGYFKPLPWVNSGYGWSVPLSCDHEIGKASSEKGFFRSRNNTQINKFFPWPYSHIFKFGRVDKITIFMTSWLLFDWWSVGQRDGTLNKKTHTSTLGIENTNTFISNLQFIRTGQP